MTKEEVLRLIKEEDVEFIRLQFTDILGNLKNIAVTAKQLDRVLTRGCKFDAAAVDGTGTIGSLGSERLLAPDYDTFAIFPWRPQQGRVARLFCNVLMPDGKPNPADVRSVLERVCKEAAEKGYRLEVGPECEFFLFDTDENTYPTVTTHEQAGYFDVGPMDGGENARRDIVLNLEEMGVDIVASHHEQAPAQHEIDLAHEEALHAADNIQTFRLAARTIARRHGLHATFMPRPREEENGSGMHLNFSVHVGEKNLFGDGEDAMGLSREAYWFMGGVMKHLRAICAVTNPLVNSYKRLLPGAGAPFYIAWSCRNRNQMFRIPATMQDEGTRIELRSPDPACNPYLALALCLAAGLEGIREQTGPMPALDEDPAKISLEELRERKIERLPKTLLEAVEEFERDPFVRRVLGDAITDRYAKIKRAEWEAYHSHVSDWELQEYLKKY